MAFLNWRQKRQFLPIAVLAFVILGVFFYFGLKTIPEATCFDGKRNQGEERVDCGGPCKPCLENLSEPTVLWTRFFKLAEGVYEGAALVENAHNFAGAKRLFYRFKLYDQNNILIAIREGETFINPKERFLILAPGLLSGEKVPARALVEFEPVKWAYTEYTPPNVVVVRRDFSLEPQPHLSAVLRNSDIFGIKNLEISAVLFDKDGRAIAASQTLLDEISGESEKIVFFSWPKTINEIPQRIEILVRKKIND